MKKVELRLNENYKYNIIKKLVETNNNEFFLHGNRNRQPSHSFSDEIKRTIIDLYRGKYYEANFEHFSELFKKYKFNCRKHFFAFCFIL